MRGASGTNWSVLVAGASVLGVSIAFFSQLGEVSVGRGFQTGYAVLWPKIVLTALAAFASILVLGGAIQSLKDRRLGRMGVSDRSCLSAWMTARAEVWVVALLLASLSAYCLSLETIGFTVATPVLVGAIQVILGERRPVHVVTTSAVVSVGLWLLFTKFAGAVMPRGIGLFRELSYFLY